VEPDGTESDADIPEYQAIIDLQGMSAPFSLMAWVDEAKAAAEMKEPDADEAISSMADWQIEYDAELLSLEYADGDYAVTPRRGFEETRITASAVDARCELTLVGWAGEAESVDVLCGAYVVPVAGADYAITVNVPAEAAILATARFVARAMDDELYGSAALNALPVPEGEQQGLLAIFDLTIYPRSAPRTKNSRNSSAGTTTIRGCSPPIWTAIIRPPRM